MLILTVNSMNNLRRKRRTRRISRKASLYKTNRKRKVRQVYQRAGATSSPAKGVEQFLDGVLYINLDSRKDRREHIEKELITLNLSKIAHRIPGAVHSQRGVGCTMAHLAALKYAKERGWKTVLILEDDFKAELDSQQLYTKLAAFFHKYSNTFDVVMLAHNINKSIPCDDLVVRIQDAQTASAYIVSERAYDRLIELFEKAIPELIKTGDHWNLINDQVWKRLQPDMLWYGFVPRLGRQIASWSDNEKKDVNYGV